MACFGHRFDKTTHRCTRCGRWQAGFAPKKDTTNARPRAECQVCEREQATNIGGSMMAHGYARPGHGYIVGNCYGVRHQPFPATSALKLWALHLTQHIAGLQRATDELDAGRGQVRVWKRDAGGYAQGAYVMTDRQVWAAGKTTYAIDDAVRSTRGFFLAEQAQATGELTRVTERIAKGDRLTGQATIVGLLT